MSENNIPPGNSPPTPESRRRKIMEYVVREGTTRVEDLADLLGVSAMTAYRDVAQLEKVDWLPDAEGKYRRQNLP